MATTGIQRQLAAEIAACRGRVDALLADAASRAHVGPDHIRRGVMAYLERPGKRLRPALLLLACRALGGDETAALPAAAAVEVFHTWTLVHDDIIDRDTLRRGSPTLHVAAAQWGREAFGLGEEAAADYGRNLAILSGDLQQAWAVSLLLETVHRGAPERLAIGLARRLLDVLTPRLIEGETLDVQLSLRPLDGIGADEVLAMMRLKTGELLGFAAAAGAALGCGRLPGEDARVDALEEFAALCGVAFQLQDDILGVTGNEHRLGKPVGADLREGKATLIVLHALAHGDPAGRERLLAVLGNRSADPEAVAEAGAWLAACGGVEHAARLARTMLGCATGRLRDTLPPSHARDLLLALAESMVARSA